MLFDVMIVESAIEAVRGYAMPVTSVGFPVVPRLVMN
jgi:hypothetical protein